MKITKRQLRRIIKEEKALILRETGMTSSLPGDTAGIPTKANAGNLQTASDALSVIYDGIEKLIQTIGPEEAYLELVGIVEDWDDTPYEGNQ